FTGDNLGDNNDETKPSEEQQLLLEVLDSYDSEIARLLEGVKEFRKAFDYKIIRIYTIPVNNSTLSSDVFMIGICFCHNQSNTLKLTVKNTKKRLIHIISTVLYE